MLTTVFRSWQPVVSGERAAVHADCVATDYVEDPDLATVVVPPRGKRSSTSRTNHASILSKVMEAQLYTSASNRLSNLLPPHCHAKKAAGTPLPS